MNSFLVSSGILRSFPLLYAGFFVLCEFVQVVCMLWFLIHVLHPYHFGFSEYSFTKGRKSKHLIDFRPEIKIKIITLLCLLVKVNPKVNVHSKGRVINPFSPFEWSIATAHSKRGNNWSQLKCYSENKSHDKNDLPYFQDIFSYFRFFGQSIVRQRFTRQRFFFIAL